MMRIPDQVQRDILHVCKRAYERGLVAGTDGNISVRVSQDRLVATPTGMCKGFLDADDLVVCDLDGRQLGGKRRLTTEIKIHLAAYAARPDVCAVVHTHPPYATAFAVAGRTPSETLMPEAYIAVGKVALAPYATPSTDALADTLRPSLQGHDAILLANHGAMTFGRDVIGAYHRMEALEQLCRVSCIAAQLGGARPLTTAQTQELEAIRGVYGPAPDANVPCYQCGFTPSRGAGTSASAGAVHATRASDRDDPAPAVRRTVLPSPHVHWPGNPPVWERPGFEPTLAEAQVRDLARRELDAARSRRDD